MKKLLAALILITLVNTAIAQPPVPGADQTESSEKDTPPMPGSDQQSEIEQNTSENKTEDSTENTSNNKPGIIKAVTGIIENLF